MMSEVIYSEMINDKYVPRFHRDVRGLYSDARKLLIDIHYISVLCYSIDFFWDRR